MDPEKIISYANSLKTTIGTKEAFRISYGSDWHPSRGELKIAFNAKILLGIGRFVENYCSINKINLQPNCFFSTSNSNKKACISAFKAIKMHCENITSVFSDHPYDGLNEILKEHIVTRDIHQYKDLYEVIAAIITTIKDLTDYTFSADITERLNELTRPNTPENSR